MANAIIASKTDDKTFGAWPLKEKISTTITLLQTGSDAFGLAYQAVYSGIKSGSVSGGPYAVSGNLNKVVNQSPKVTLIVSNYSDTGSYISMRVIITVDIPVIGTETIFDETLGGSYSQGGLQAIVDHIGTLSSQAKPA